MPRSPSPEVLQGTLDLLVLKTVAVEPMHGWGIAQRIQERSEQALEIALRELDRVRSDLRDEEVERAKNKLAGSAVLHGESPQGRMRAIGGSWVYNNRYRSLEEDLGALLAVTPRDLKRLMERYCFDPMTVVTLGP